MHARSRWFNASREVRPHCCRVSVSDSTSLIVLTKPNRVRTLTIPDDTAYVTQYMNAIFAVPLNSEDRYELPI